MASFSPFDRLPAELRVKIHVEILGASKVITPVEGGNTTLNGDCLLQPGTTALSTKPRLHTAILRTNKLIFKESLDVLYSDRTVRINIEQLRNLLCNKNFRDNVERIEIEAEVDDCTKEPGISTFAPTLLQLQALPQTPSIVILSDRLGLIEGIEDGLIDNTEEGYVTVREFVRRTHLGQAVCTDIGRFSLCGKFKDIQIVHQKLVRMWPEVVNTPAGYHVRSDVHAAIRAARLWPWFLRVPTWAAQTSLRRWVGLYDDILRLVRGSITYQSVNGEELSLLRRFSYSLRRPSRQYYTGNGDLLLHELKPSEASSSLEAATDLISINIAGYYAEVSRDRNVDPPRLCAAHWADVDGGMHTLDIMGTHWSSALRGEVNAHYLCHPLTNDHFTETLMVRAFLRSRTTHARWPTADEMRPDEVRQIYLLHLAIYSGLRDDEERQVMDPWSLQLLKRYLLAARLVHADELKNTTLRDTRLAMCCSYSLLMMEDGPRDGFLTNCGILIREDEPVDELDEDLVRNLSWKYNGVIVHFWRTIVRESLGAWQDEGGVTMRCLEVLELESRQDQTVQAAAA